jgi:hypothetical protein
MGLNIIFSSFFSPFYKWNLLKFRVKHPQIDNWLTLVWNLNLFSLLFFSLTFYLKSWITLSHFLDFYCSTADNVVKWFMFCFFEERKRNRNLTLFCSYPLEETLKLWIDSSKVFILFYFLLWKFSFFHLKILFLLNSI